MDKVKLFGQTKRDIKVIISMIKSMERVFSNGEMVNNIRDNGKMENSTDKDSSFYQLVNKKKGFGITVKGYLG